MIVTKRTKLSLCQFLDLFEQDVVHVLLEKYGVTIWSYSQTEISEVVSNAEQAHVYSLQGIQWGKEFFPFKRRRKRGRLCSAFGDAVIDYQ
jgi:hypothetical protein